MFISFEGIDGCGKTTQVERLVAWSRDRGLDPLHVREPGGTVVGEQVRQILLSHDTGDIAPAAEALLYAAARAELVEKTIRPALEAGRLVVADRFVDSSLAYQGGGRRLGVEAVRSANDLATRGLLPDVTILLRLDAERAAERRGAGDADDRVEASGEKFYARVATAYEQIAAAEPERFLVVDADASAEDVHALVIRELEPRLGQLLGATSR